MHFVAWGFLLLDDLDFRYIELLLCLRKPEKDDKNSVKSPAQKEVCKEKNASEMVQEYEEKQVIFIQLRYQNRL